jgi:hypothetical protein
MDAMNIIDLKFTGIERFVDKKSDIYFGRAGFVIFIRSYNESGYTAI